MADDVIHASVWEQRGKWYGRFDGIEGKDVAASSKTACVALLRRAAGRKNSLTVEVIPRLAGVAEAAEIMGWDKRRVITYLDRDRFPEPFAWLKSGRVWRREDVESFAKEWRSRHRRRN
ncbi:MAG: hypothetical protein WD276_01870 [Actinomycetota bacterium]